MVAALPCIPRPMEGCVTYCTSMVRTDSQLDQRPHLDETLEMGLIDRTRAVVSGEVADEGATWKGARRLWSNDVVEQDWSGEVHE